MPKRNPFRNCLDPRAVFRKIMGEPKDIPLTLDTIMNDNRNCLCKPILSSSIKEYRKEVFKRYRLKKPKFKEPRKKYSSRVSIANKRMRVYGVFIPKEDEDNLKELINHPEEYNKYIEIIKKRLKEKRLKEKRLKEKRLKKKEK